MKVTWTFIGGLAAGLALMFGLTGVAFYLNLGTPSDSSAWAYEILQKKHQLVETSSPPRLLIVGGSATLFGVSAKEIESQCGLRTINLGSHAALGNEYLLRIARQCARPGDTVLLIPEYELYGEGKVEPRWADKLFIDYLVSRDPAYFASLSFLERWDVFMLMPNDRLVRGVKTRFRAPRPPVFAGLYDPAYIDRWGDQTGHKDALKPADRTPILTTKSMALIRGLPEPMAGLPPIAAFCQWAREHNVRVLASYPNIADQPGYHSPEAQKFIASIEAFYKSQNVPVAGRYTDFIYPTDQFFDTMYHLTEEAAAARSRQLARMLDGLLKPPAR